MSAQVSRVFALVEEFVSLAVPVSRGHLLLLTTKSGGELSGLEFDRTVKREEMLKYTNFYYYYVYIYLMKKM